MGSVEVSAERGAQADPLVLRILGGAELAPVPTLVRRGERESYVRNARREGADVVARVPWPAAGGRDHYELVDLSNSEEWKVQPELKAQQTVDPQERIDAAGQGARGKPSAQEPG